jgi:tripartite-type tricarboxylate transporter receptor subunit TctC
MHSSERREFLAPALLALFGCWLGPAAAAGGQPVRMIVPLAPGTTADFVARILGRRLALATGRPVVVENQPAAAGVPATAQIARGANDGSVLGVVASNHVINSAMIGHLPFDPLADVAPITVIGSFPLVLVAVPSLPVHGVQDLVALARQRPGTLNYGSGGSGSLLHLAAELLRAEAGGFDVQHVPYNGTAQMTADLLRQQIQFGFLSATVATPLIRSGRLRVLGVSTPTRSALLPGVPTLAEQGLPHYSFDAWVALVAPGGMAPPLVARHHALVRAALDAPEVREALARQGMTVIGNSPAQAAAFLAAELARHTALVRQSGAVPD